MPAMRPNCRSSGVATAEAIVSGLAVGQSNDMNIFDPVLHIGDIGQSNWRAVLVGYDQVAILIGEENLVVVVNGPGIRCVA